MWNWCWLAHLRSGDLLGEERFALAEVIARESGDDSQAAATRVWCAVESLKKAGSLDGRPILFSEVRPEGWIHLTAGSATIATLVTIVRDTPGPVAFAFSIE